ncbi:MICOS complex subunit Mic25-like isoform X2 [Anguilla rostrata]|uniref:MICOS complex subunit Mic25-like isoform X2 n=1 Tax=Anguilla rostrata TaxID=7938 RepID=UPI0030CF1CE0
MGANASAYEEDDETITVMKGVRLTENVINRMRGASASANTQSPPTIPVPSLPAQTTAPLLPLSAPGEPPPLPVEPASASPPPSVEPILSSPSAESALQFAHPPSVEPESTPSPPPPPLSVEPAPSAPPPTSVEPAPQPPHPPSEEPAPSPLCVETTPLSPPPSVEPTPQPPPPLSVEPAPSAPPRTSVEPAAAPPPTSVKPALPSPHPSLEPAPSSSLSVEPAPPPPRLVEPAAPAFVEPVSPTPCPVVSEEELCRTVTQEQELQKGREQHMSLTELEVHQGVEQEKVQAQTQVEERFAEENLKQSILADRTAAQDHRLRAHLYAHQLEQRIRELKKQDALYREQVAKLEWRGKRFYSAITESYQKASREVSAKFRQNQINPVCADLQREILKCYRENTGHTLSCSKIASLYLQCVTEARQSKTRPGD